ncbi:MAG: hypothetical protein WDN66_02830 [Candidatus Saccharibacteria bacterium]
MPTVGAGETTAAGVLIYGGDGDPIARMSTVENNKFVDNDEAVNFANYNSDGSGQSTSVTNDVADSNWIFSSHVTNTSGLVANNGNFGYQAGIEDIGDKTALAITLLLALAIRTKGTYVATPTPTFTQTGRMQH